MNRLRAVLDLVATVSLILAAGTFVWFAMHQQNPTTSAAARRPAVNTSLPKAPITLDGANIQGDAHAKVALLVYSDFQCPYCGAFARDTLPSIEDKYVRSGKVLIAFRNYPLSIHSSALPAAEAAECAAAQGKFWQMHDRLFSDQASLTPDTFLRDAGDLELDGSQFQACVQKHDETKIRADEEQARTLGISGTPTIFVGILTADHRLKALKRLTGTQAFPRFDQLLASLVSTGTLSSTN